MAYEIEVDGQKIYEFSAQAQKIKATQDRRLWQLIWAVILFGLPSVVFYFINKIVIRDLEVVVDEETSRQDGQELNIVSPTIASRMGVGGHVWRIWFGVLGTVALMAFLATWVVGRYANMTAFAIMTIGLYYVASLPRQNAKREVTIYQEFLQAGEDVGELSDYESSGFYNHMGVLSWLFMVLSSALAFFFAFCIVIWVFRDEGVESPYAVMTILCVCFMLFVGLMGVIIKRAMSRRNLAVK